MDSVAPGNHAVKQTAVITIPRGPAAAVQACRQAQEQRVRRGSTLSERLSSLESLLDQALDDVQYVSECSLTNPNVPSFVRVRIRQRAEPTLRAAYALVTELGRLAESEVRG